MESFEEVQQPLSAEAGVIRGRRVVCIRVPDFEKFPDGDAMNGFTKSTNPPGLVARLTHHVVKAQADYACEPRAASAKYKRRGDKIKIVFNDTSQLTSLLRIKRRGVSVARDVPAQAAALSGMNLFRDYPLMIPILIPNQEAVLNSVADGVGAANEEQNLQMTPYLSETIMRAAAAVSIQSAFRSYLCRKTLKPCIAELVLMRRAAVCVQRYYAQHTRKLRIVMYKQMKEMMSAIGTKTCELEVSSEAMGRLIGFMQEGPYQVFTEQKYMYAFDPYDNVYTCRLPPGLPSSAARVDEALDRGLPKWIGVSVPHAPVQAMADADPDETEAFDCVDIIPMLTTSVETVDAPPEEPGEMKRSKPDDGPPARLMRFESNEEARRRAALIFLFTWDPHERRGGGWCELTHRLTHELERCPLSNKTVKHA